MYLNIPTLHCSIQPLLNEKNLKFDKYITLTLDSFAACKHLLFLTKNIKTYYS